MDSAERNDIGIGLLSTKGKAEGISDVIGNLLNFLDLVVVGQNHGIPFLFQSKNFGTKIVRGEGSSHKEGIAVDSWWNRRF